MHNTPLVSIITPCYNGEKYIHRFLDSIVAQTYKNIELIFVNDGSTDDTEAIVFSYNETLIQNGIELIYIYQENKGLGGAINAGLKRVKGKYLCWPDSDDYLEPESVEKRVEILEKFPEYAVVTSDAYIRDIKNIEKPLGLIAGKKSEKYNKNQFELLLSGNSLFCSGTHMMRKSAFSETHPDGQIIPCRRGQNWQILLPVYYQHKRYFLDEPLYNYIRYHNSMSQGDTNEKQKLYRSNEHEEILTNTISSMSMPSREKNKYLLLIKEIYSRKNLRIAYEYNNRSLFKTQYDCLRNEKRLNFKDKVMRLTFEYIWLRSILDILVKIKIHQKNNVN